MTGVFTNNWRGIKNALLLGGAVYEGFSTVYTNAGALATGTISNNISPMANLKNSYALSSSDSTNVVRFGTSDTAPEATDIDLGNAWSSGVSYVSVTNGTREYNTGTATCSRTFEVVVQNTASASVTVREFGIFARVSNTGTAVSMLYRAVLDEPVTLSQNDSAKLTFTVSIRLNDPI